MENKKMKVWKKILLVILTIVVVALLLIIRKMIIMKDLSNKVLQYVESKNSYVRITSDNKNNGCDYFEEYKNDNVIKTVSKRKNEDVYIIQFDKPNETKIYLNTPETKTLNITQEQQDIGQREIIIRPVYDGTIIDNFFAAVFTSIRSEKLNGVDCYVLSSFEYTCIPGSYIGKVYVEKDTGLTLKRVEYKTEDSEQKETTIRYEYKFNENTDECMKEPDVSQYTIQTNN